MKYLRKNLHDLQLISLQFSGQCYIFKCFKLNIFLRIKLGTFFGEKGRYNEHKNILKNSFTICCTSHITFPGLLTQGVRLT